MSKEDTLIWAGAALVAGYFIYKQIFPTETKEQRIEKNNKILDTSKGDYKVESTDAFGNKTTTDIKRVDQSIDKGKTLIRNQNPDGSITTYKVDTGDLTPSESRAIAGGRYSISGDVIDYGLLAKSLGGLISSPVPKTQFNSTVQSTISSDKSLRTVSRINTNPTVSINGVQTAQANVTYKGTPTQIAVGRTIDTVKSISSTISNFFSPSKSVRK